MDDDTDTLIALVSSLLPRSTYAQDVILDALIQSNGDVEAAVETLRSKKPTKKRNHTVLDSWLNPPAKKISTRRDSPVPLTFSGSTTKPYAPTVSASSSGPSINLMSILRQPPSDTSSISCRLPPFILTTPALVAEHTPCTLHLSVLPPELACKLFYTMMDESKEWKRNKWWIADKVVESPHLTSFYVRKTDGLDEDEAWQETAQYWYNGRATDPPPKFPPEMEEACEIVQQIVNEEMRNRQRFKLEWNSGALGDADSLWRANVAASNRYQGGKESVGFHCDQLTYLGPYPTIASLSLGTRRNFSLREVIPTRQKGLKKPQTFNIPLAHNSLIIMHARCQEKFKHSVPPQPTIDIFKPQFPREPGAAIESSNCRINITFRFYRPDFRPPSIPRCDCGVPTILRPDMKNTINGETDQYWWTCYAGAQNEGKGCKFWKVMDIKEEGRV